MDLRAINTIRMLSVDMIERAKSGHPGLPLGSAPMAYVLFKNHLKFNPKDPKWINRDRFVLSAGHGSALLYSLLYLFGYNLNIEDLKNFRQLHSKTPGHPEFGITDGVEATTGPLGQGLAMFVGLALAESHLNQKLKYKDESIIDHYTYCLVGDGCLMEGISHEAASFAGNHKLNKLIVLYDSNNISIEGDTSITFRDDTRKRFESYGWDTFLVEDGNDIQAIDRAISEAKLTDKPSLIEIKTTIGYGAGSVEGSEKSHGAPIGNENREILVERLKTNQDEFFVSDEIKEFFKNIIEEKTKLYDQEIKKTNELLKIQEIQDLYNEYFNCKTNVDLSEYFNIKEDDATRSSSGFALNKISEEVKNLIGGSADLGPSNNSEIKSDGFMTAIDKCHRNIHFGVREFAMAAICNGMTLHGGLKVYCATFFVFSDYMKPAIRLSALMKLPVIYILTHDSIGVGEDGPTHQPIEHLAMLRSIPGLQVIRPADFNETLVAWEEALKSDKPTALILSRQKLPTISQNAKELTKGAYVIKKEDKSAQVTLISTGSEVSLSLKVSEILKANSVDTRVVSMPSTTMFENMDAKYKEQILPENSKIFVIEAASSFGWHKYAKDKNIIAIDNFGESGKGSDLFKYFGFDETIIASKILKEIGVN